MKVGLVQQCCSSDVRANVEKLKRNVTECAKMGAELVVLQELHNSLYFCQTEDVSCFDLAEFLYITIFIKKSGAGQLSLPRYLVTIYSNTI